MLNPVMLAQMVRNPQVFMQRAMNDSQLMQNPIAKNTLEMMQKGDSKGLEELARNVCKEKGINPDDALKQMKSQFGMN